MDRETRAILEELQKSEALLDMLEAMQEVRRELRKRYSNKWRQMKTEAQQVALVEELMVQLVAEGTWEVFKDAGGRKMCRRIRIVTEH